MYKSICKNLPGLLSVKSIMMQGILRVEGLLFVEFETAELAQKTPFGGSVTTYVSVL